MITYRVEDCRPKELQCSGDTREIVADICFMLNAIYSALEKSSHDSAEAFREGLMLTLVSPDLVWTADKNVNCICLTKPKEDKTDD